MDQYRKKIEQSLASAYPDTEIVFTEPPDPTMGDISIPCFTLAKTLRRNPSVIASDLAEVISKDPELHFVKKTENSGGYLNIFIDKPLLVKDIITAILSQGPAYGSSSSGRSARAIVEHTSINPNASPHVGRARNALIGDCIVRLLRFEGYEVEVHYFVNDIGKQIAMLLLGAMQKSGHPDPAISSCRSGLPGSPDFSVNSEGSGGKNIRFEDLLDIYVAINKKAAEDPDIEKQVFSLLYALENGDSQIRGSFRTLVNTCIDGQSAIFEKLGIKYDVFDYESDYIYKGTAAAVLEMLRQTGKLEEDEEGRLALNQSEYSLPLKAPYLVLTRKDKTSLYPLRDIAYTMDKIRSAPDMNIVVLGEDQKLYFRQIAAALDLLGYKAPEPVHYSFVLLAEGKMATRKGNVVLLEDFMNEAVSKATAEIRKRRDCSDPAAASAIGFGAVKYAILRASNDKNVTFDWDSALSFEGESGPYLQYSLARINSIFKRSGEVLQADPEKIDYAVLSDPLEIELAKEAAAFPSAVRSALKSYSPHIIAGYVYGLTKKFSVFYHECPVLNAESDELRMARLCLIEAVRQVILNCFGLLGIEPVDIM
ncbi:MAG: arginine--tRNA ligase [Eubacteriales bacterium]|nr:arginine--tRNA ligase [Eubacteriales bacterium]